VSLGTPAAILIGFFILAAAVLLEGRLSSRPRYTLTSNSSGIYVRLDTWNGETVGCLPGRDEASRKLLVTCTGREL
jgi:hypothetical protein